MAFSKGLSGRTLLCVALVAAALLQLMPRPALAISGKATYYTAPYTPSACYGYDSPPSDGLFAAANPSIYNSGAACGTHYTIACTGSGCNGGGHITVEIIDLCPGCASNQFDLSEQAFSDIADLAVGVISIDYNQA